MMKTAWLNKHSYLFYCILSGVLLALSWPARGLPLLAFVALIPLLYVEDQLHLKKKDFKSVVFFLHAWTAFFIFNLLTTWWIMFATIPGMIVAVILNATFMAIPWWIMHKSRRILPGKQGQLSIILLWLTFEYLHGLWELSWSWLDLGNVFASWPAWVQWYDITGVAGGTLWVLLINLLLFSAIRQGIHKQGLRKRSRWNLIMALVIFVVPSFYSIYTWITYEEALAPIEVVIIQPAEDPYEQAATQAAWEARVEQMIRLADESISPATRFVVAPEGVNPRGIWIHDAESHYTITRLRQHMEAHPHITWIFGSFTYRLYERDEKPPATARPYGESGYFFDAYNSAIMVARDQPIQYHHKYKLVPGIERMPYFRLLQPVGSLVDRFGGISGSLGTTDRQTVFSTTDGIRIAPAVCYESIYGEYLGGFIRQGAGFLFIMTNDGWWRDTPGYRQHNQYARLRAIESRRSVARAASTGISSFIDQRGEILMQTSWWDETSLATTINAQTRLTFYNRTGNFLGKLALFLSALLIFYMISQGIIRKGTQT